MSRYNTGRSWTLDHNRHNKSESYEKPMSERKTYRKGGSSSSSSGSSSKRARKYTYIPNAEIESLTTWNGVTFEGKDLLDGAYARGKVKYDDGGMMGKMISVFRINTTAYDEEDFYLLTSLSEKEIVKTIKPIVEEERNGEGMYENETLYWSLKEAYPNEVVEYYNDFETISMKRGGRANYIPNKSIKSISIKNGAFGWGGKMASGGDFEYTPEQQAEVMVGYSTWQSLDQKTRNELIADFVANEEVMMAKAGAVSSKFTVEYTLASGKKMKKTYATKDDMEEGIADFYGEYDVVDVQILDRPKEEKKSLFATAKPAETKKKKTGAPEVEVEGVESDIERYDELKEIIKNSKAESDILAGRIKEVGVEKYLQLYKERGTRPQNFIMVDGDQSILLQVKDAYKSVSDEKKEILEKMYPQLLQEDITYSIDTTILDKKARNGKTIGEVISELIKGSGLIPEEYKENLIKESISTSIKKGAIEELGSYGKKLNEVFDLIEPTVALL